MSNVYLDTDKLLAEWRQKSDRVIVAYSGGKDSLVALDLAVRNFPTVVPVLFHFVPGLSLDQRACDFVRDRYGLTVHCHQAYSLYECLMAGQFCFKPKVKGYKKIKVTETLVYAMLRQEYESPFVLTGCRRTDSWQRRQMIDAGTMPGDHPIAWWTKYNVLAYLRRANIPLPPSHKGATTGIGITARSLLWLHDDYPEDFAKVESYFPFIRAVVKRRDWYNVPAPRLKTKTRPERVRQVQSGGDAPLAAQGGAVQPAPH